MKKHFFIGALISGVCLYFAFRGLSLREIAHALGQADLRWIAIALAVYASCLIFRSIRWEGLIASIQNIPARQLLRPLILGFFCNNVLPFRMGELVRAHVAGRKFGISRTACLGTIVLERMFDALSFLTIFLALAFFFPFPTAIKHGARVMGGGAAVGLVVLWFAFKHQDQVQRLLRYLPLSPKWIDKLNHLIVNFTQGVSGVTRGPSVARAIALSWGIWILEGTTVYCIARAFPIELSYPGAFFVLFFLGLSVALPQAPGYVGTVELFGTTALNILGIPKEQGLPVILALHGAQFTFICLLGVYALWKERISFDRLIQHTDA